jgi:hypothetical protein
MQVIRGPCHAMPVQSLIIPYADLQSLELWHGCLVTGRGWERRTLHASHYTYYTNCSTSHVRTECSCQYWHYSALCWWEATLQWYGWAVLPRVRCGTETFVADTDTTLTLTPCNTLSLQHSLTATLSHCNTLSLQHSLSQYRWGGLLHS